MDTAPLKNLIRFLKHLPEEVAISADRAIDENAHELVNENVSQIEQSGKDSEGQPIMYKLPRKTPADGAYSTKYKRYKEKRGGETKFVNLKMDGEFLKSLNMQRKSTGVWRFQSTDDRLLAYLIEMYGESILGVENLQGFSDARILPAIERDIEKRLTGI